MRALVCALLAAGCAKTVADLYPINCTQDGLCPAPYVCIDNECLTSEPCDPVDATGCSAVHPRCTLARTGRASYGGQCTALAGSAAVGGACQVLRSAYEQDNPSGAFPWPDKDCSAGSICYAFEVWGISFESSVPGVCRAFCARSGACPSGSKCLDAFGPRYLPGYAGPTKAVGICYPECALLASGSCAGALECTPGLDIDGASGFGLCRAVGEFPRDEGTECSMPYPCAAGHACVPDGGKLVCRKLCKPGGSPGCTAPKSCNTTLVQLAGAGVCR